ncbi:MAG: hypothetical protein M3552_20875 [Planctomycetota bacterium]|nr:hypothetical protein [Planctomycetota bacterium]
MTAVAATLSRSAWAGMTVYVAFLLIHSANAAEVRQLHPVPDDASDAASPQAMQVPPPGTPTPYGPLPPPAPPFRDTIYGAHINPGMPDSPAFLHPHLPEYQTLYGIWYQPRAYREPAKQVYRQSPFRPRGWGNLFDDPCLTDRMDYNRYVVKDLPSRYGPSYYPKYVPASECVIFRPERHYTPPVYGAAE